MKKSLIILLHSPKLIYHPQKQKKIIETPKKDVHGISRCTSFSFSEGRIDSFLPPFYWSLRCWYMTLAKVSTLARSSSFGCLAEPERRQHSLRILVSVFPNGYFSNIFRTVSFDTAPRQRKVPFGKLSEGRRFLAFCMLAMACADSGSAASVAKRNMWRFVKWRSTFAASSQAVPPSIQKPRKTQS